MTLIEPIYPVNVGHTARLVKNFGVKKLYLVKPKVDISVAPSMRLTPRMSSTGP